jgi:hypothetical protein
MANDDYDDDPWHGHNGSEMGPFLSPVVDDAVEAGYAAYNKELEQMKKTLIVLHKKHAWRKFARDEEIAALNQCLAALGLPVLPQRRQPQGSKKDPSHFHCDHARGRRHNRHLPWFSPFSFL